MSFSIKFIRDSITDLEPGEKAKYGRITLGAFRERVFISLDYWTVTDYRRHWHQAVKRIVKGSKFSCLITSMDDPTTAKYITWRPMYRVRDTIYVQDHMLFLDSLPIPFDVENPFKSVPPRKTVNEEGEQISEWSVPLSDVEVFGHRLSPL